MTGPLSAEEQAQGLEENDLPDAQFSKSWTAMTGKTIPRRGSDSTNYCIYHYQYAPGADRSRRNTDRATGLGLYDGQIVDADT